MTQKAMHADGQPVNLPALYGEWVSHSMQRLAADLQECQECGSEIAATLGGTMPQWPGVAGFEPKQARPAAKNRSEEHTSELQSLMRISYAVFCLKKKKNTNNKAY